MPARIVGADDEAKLRRRPRANDCAVRCARPMIISARPGARAYAARPGVARGFGQSFEHGRVGVAEGKTDAAGKRSVAQRMRADCLGLAVARASAVRCVGA